MGKFLPYAGCQVRGKRMNGVKKRTEEKDKLGTEGRGECSATTSHRTLGGPWSNRIEKRSKIVAVQPCKAGPMRLGKHTLPTSRGGRLAALVRKRVEGVKGGGDHKIGRERKNLEQKTGPGLLWMFSGKTGGRTNWEATGRPQMSKFGGFFLLEQKKVSPEPGGATDRKPKPKLTPDEGRLWPQN